MKSIKLLQSVFYRGAVAVKLPLSDTQWIMYVYTLCNVRNEDCGGGGVRIKTSEENVLDIVNIMKTDFINPFSTALDPDKVYNLDSGCLLPDDILARLRNHTLKATMT